MIVWKILNHKWFLGFAQIYLFFRYQFSINIVTKSPSILSWTFLLTELLVYYTCNCSCSCSFYDEAWTMALESGWNSVIRKVLVKNTRFDSVWSGWFSISTTLKTSSPMQRRQTFLMRYHNGVWVCHQSSSAINLVKRPSLLSHHPVASTVSMKWQKKAVQIGFTNSLCYLLSLYNQPENGFFFLLFFKIMVIIIIITIKIIIIKQFEKEWNKLWENTAH